MIWTEEQLELAKKYKTLEDIPEEERRYKCHTCHMVVEESPCPNCGETHLEIMCPLDHCGCSHDIIEKIEYCPLCGQPICPECGSHDVSQVSRVTGYLADVAGWNQGKQQELKDRSRYTVA
ncbi:oxygen-sensitive ribonucleoside-triphosphate reductase-like protein [Methanolacinia petrolearia DSM 11571]|uniref:Oxygen-sensitive ribonucleoside-triphosphate reductase-like protein n=1 Tax=Methanolacinia petrolearia (strain DSM 11571 / OCM 486 / SEBR 4847) TaxID=679926 RepID=E1RE36_METP4|nr:MULTISPECIES: anaerobic ribonucleoside-triphosphate reductase [Methanolacinia]ADN34927.1 oxygen-sensitive ribonucleoside-triphosphate reductase-like protein [Methanolacinia petrolearia DSM 11571]